VNRLSQSLGAWPVHIGWARSPLEIDGLSNLKEPLMTSRIRPGSAHLVAALLIPAAAAQPYSIPWHTIDGGGVMWSAGGGWELGATVGQPDAGPAMSGGGFVLAGGFWYGAPVPSASGDLDGDGDVDLDDYGVFSDCLSGPEGGVAAGCEAADLNGDGYVDLDDFARFQLYFGGL